jgi:ATP/maltotriose-dependent transcriptional regulator MalT
MTGNGVHARIAAFAAEAERLVAGKQDDLRAQPLARAASIYARLGEAERAGAAVEAAASVATAEVLPYFQVINLVLVAEAYARLGRVRKAEGYTGQADGLVRMVDEPDWHGQSRAMVAGAMARTGAPPRPCSTPPTRRTATLRHSDRY